MPAATPSSAPLPDVIDAMVPLLLLHLPPPVASASVVDAPIHSANDPVIVAGDGFTETVAEVMHPVPIA